MGTEPALTAEVRSGLGAVGRIARALVSAVTLPELAEGALEAMRDALSLEVAALYVPPSDARPVLERLAVAGAQQVGGRSSGSCSTTRRGGSPSRATRRW